jgi:hypothetical protein
MLIQGQVCQIQSVTSLVLLSPPVPRQMNPLRFVLTRGNKQGSIYLSLSDAFWLPLHLSLGYALIISMETRSYTTRPTSFVRIDGYKAICPLGYSELLLVAVASKFRD